MVQTHAKDLPVLHVMPELGRIAMRPGHWRVRQRLLIAVGTTALAHDKPCPSVLFDALYDEDVNPAAEFQIHYFKRLDDKGVRALIKYATSSDIGHRQSGVSMLSHSAGHSPEAVRTIRRLTEDPDYLVRNNAHVALFRITKDLNGFLVYIFRLRSEYLDWPESKEKLSEQEMREKASFSLLQLGFAQLMYEWCVERPGDLRDSAVRAMAHPDAHVRRGAASYLAGIVGGLEVPPSIQLTTDPFDPATRPRQREGMSLIVRDIARDRLRELSQFDPDESVRKTAHDALMKIGSIQRR